MVSGPPAARVVLLATRNAGKLRELLPMFAEAGLVPRTLDDMGIVEDPGEAALETAETFEGNALAKARHFHARSGHPTVADDSGLAVSALGGAPGVRSRRWSGRADLHGAALDAANNALLLERLAGTADRRARFVCAAAWVDGGRELVRVGECAGRIALAPSAGGHGFGYDPLFVSDELGATFAEVDREAKSRVSHRARAFAALLAAVGGAGSSA
jgi:XTP/dITP diphosphohydrolase